jgi:hypothetical protein
MLVHLRLTWSGDFGLFPCKWLLVAGLLIAVQMCAAEGVQSSIKTVGQVI